MPNVRIRGKISHNEWPKIVLRFQNGETLTEIARSYRCTAPAIRYIVAQVTKKGGSMAIDRGSGEKVALRVPPEDRRSTRIDSTADRSHLSQDQNESAPQSPTRDIWGRINTDIATFLAAMDCLSSNDSDSNYEALLAATDRLLWASARTRLELERVLSDRRKAGPLRRASG